MRKEIHEIRLREWEKLFEDYRASGLSQRQWCEQHNLKLRAFQYWQHLLREEALTKAEQSSNKSTMVPVAAESPHQDQFVEITPQIDRVPIKVPDKPVAETINDIPQPAPEIKIEFGNYKVFVKSCDSEDILKMVLRSLKNA